LFVSKWEFVALGILIDLLGIERISPFTVLWSIDFDELSIFNAFLD
jgi:hypothetical protein